MPGNRSARRSPSSPGVSASLAAGRRRRGDGVEVGPLQRVTALLVRGQAPLEDGLDERAHGRRVAHAHQVEGPPHGDGADHPPVEQEPAEVVGHEAVEAAQQLVVGRPRGLGLQPDEVGDGVEGADRRAVEQELAGEGGPVQRPPVDPRGSSPGPRPGSRAADAVQGGAGRAQPGRTVGRRPCPGLRGAARLARALGRADALEGLAAGQVAQPAGGRCRRPWPQGSGPAAGDRDPSAHQQDQLRR